LLIISIAIVESELFRLFPDFLPFFGLPDGRSIMYKLRSLLICVTLYGFEAAIMGYGAEHEAVSDHVFELDHQGVERAHFWQRIPPRLPGQVQNQLDMKEEHRQLHLPLLLLRVIRCYEHFHNLEERAVDQEGLHHLHSFDGGDVVSVGDEAPVLEVIPPIVHHLVRLRVDYLLLGANCLRVFNLLFFDDGSAEHLHFLDIVYFGSGLDIL